MVNDRRMWGWVVPLLLVFAVLAGSRINVDALWLDEELTYAIVGAGRYGDGYTPGGIFTYMGKIGETTPPLYYFIVAAWGRVMGWSAFGLRWLALLWGCLSIAVVYQLGRQMGARRVGVFAAALMSFAAFFVYYGHEARVYTQAVFFVVASIVLYQRVTRPDSRPVHKLLFVLALTALLYTHYIPALTAVALGLYHLLATLWNKRKFEVLFLFAIAAVLAVPWLGVVVIMAQRVAEMNESAGFAAVSRDVVYTFGNGLWVMLPALLLLSVPRVRDWRVRFLWAVTLLTAVLSLLADVVIGYLFHIRFLIGLLPLVLVLAAVGLDALTKRTHAYAAVAVLVVWGIGGAWYSYKFDLIESLHMQERTLSLQAMHTMRATADDCIAADDVAVLYFQDNLEREWIHDLTFQYYLDGVNFRYTDLDTLRHLPTLFNPDYRSIRDVPLDKSAPYGERVGAYVNGAPRVWLFADPTLPYVARLAEFEGVLRESGYEMCARVLDTRHLQVYVWSQADVPLTCEDAVLSACAGDIITR